MGTLLDSTDSHSTKVIEEFSAQTDAAINHTQAKKIDTFDLFPQLPVELRLKIWRFTLPG
jgi:hypothetical protein